jgi:hypothetical protein
MRVWNGFNWLRIGSREGLLDQYETSDSKKGWESHPAE